MFFRLINSFVGSWRAPDWSRVPSTGSFFLGLFLLLARGARLVDPTPACPSSFSWHTERVIMYVIVHNDQRHATLEMFPNTCCALHSYITCCCQFDGLCPQRYCLAYLIESSCIIICVYIQRRIEFMPLSLPVHPPTCNKQPLPTSPTNSIKIKTRANLRQT